MSFVGWFIFSIYVGIGFIALPIDCINSFRHRPKVRTRCPGSVLLRPCLVSGRDCTTMRSHPPPRPAQVLSISEARAQRKALLGRATELMRLGEAMAGGIIEFNDDVKSKKERRKRAKLDTQEMNRYRVLVDMLEHDLDEFQLCDPQNYRVRGGQAAGDGGRRAGGGQ